MKLQDKAVVGGVGSGKDVKIYAATSLFDDGCSHNVNIRTRSVETCTQTCMIIAVWSRGILMETCYQNVETCCLIMDAASI